MMRSDNTDLTRESDDSLLTAYLWKIVSEMIKTVVENNQNMIIKGCYIPPGFMAEYLEKIKCICLVMTEKYITNHFDDIR